MIDLSEIFQSSDDQILEVILCQILKLLILVAIQSPKNQKTLSSHDRRPQLISDYGSHRMMAPRLAHYQRSSGGLIHSQFVETDCAELVEQEGLKDNPLPSYRIRGLALSLETLSVP